MDILMVSNDETETEKNNQVAGFLRQIVDQFMDVFPTELPGRTPPAREG